MDLPWIKFIEASETVVRVGFSDHTMTISKQVAMQDVPLLVLQDEMLSIQELPQLNLADIGPMLPGLIRFESWNETDVKAGLRNFANILRKDLLSLSASGISFVFQVGTTFWDEKQFIEQLAAKQEIEAIDNVKLVIDAWCDALREHEATFGGDEDGAGPLAYFLEYLAERDDHCSDYLRAYCVARDGEHESYSRDEVLGAYLNRLGCTRPDLWGLEVFYTLLFPRDGRFSVKDGKVVSDWMQAGLLDKARAELKPQDFAQVVAEELKFFGEQPDVFAAFGTHQEAAEKAKQDLLEQLGETRWDQAVLAALTEGTAA